MDDKAILRDFTPGDFFSAGALARQQWGDEAGEIPSSLCRKLYEYLVRYYYVPGSPFSCAAAAGGELKGFLLASAERHSSCEADRWMQEQQLSEEEQVFFESYKAYIDGNKYAEEKELQPREALLLLFVSVQKGCGALLMEEFQRRCREHGISSMLLWTDDTCDFDWYRRKGFSEVAVFPAKPSLPGRQLTTFLFRKAIE